MCPVEVGGPGLGPIIVCEDPGDSPEPRAATGEGPGPGEGPGHGVPPIGGSGVDIPHTVKTNVMMKVA